MAISPYLKTSVYDCDMFAKYFNVSWMYNVSGELTKSYRTITLVDTNAKRLTSSSYTWLKM